MSPELAPTPDHDWITVQVAMQAGESMAPLLPLGDSAAYLWIPKNGCTTLKRAWLVALGPWSVDAAAEPIHLDVHGAVLPYTHWRSPDQLAATARQRQVVAVWRDPVERFVSACRSHLVELTTSRILAKLRNASSSGQDFERCVAVHDALFRRHGVRSYDDDSDPAAMMNRVALELPRWIPCHIDWSHHTLPQTAFLGGDPALIHDLVPMEAINDLVRHWSQAAGRPIPPAPLHVSAGQAAVDPFRRLAVSDLTPEALTALETFYAADRLFLQRWSALHAGLPSGWTPQQAR
ncbi:MULTISPECIES: sulfotransferase family 2 domain-containing protein [Aphanothece]|uniref:sulfotransferase family 2 domain-containing protein n=1 Tax=Aphanothece TaxID=1121 RepID=UPI00398E3C3C